MIYHKMKVISLSLTYLICVFCSQQKKRECSSVHSKEKCCTLIKHLIIHTTRLFCSINYDAGKSVILCETSHIKIDTKSVKQKY